MVISVVGINHKNAPVEMRERLSFGQEQLGPALDLLREYVSEGVLLSTCNRTEVYGFAEDEASGLRNIKAFLCDFHHLPPERFESHLYIYVQEEAAKHLFAVTAGLDSMILGEPQILGQVRQAFEQAQAHGSAGSVLSFLFRQALSVGKRARTETEIGRNAASVSYAAVQLAKSIFGSLATRNVLVVGAGRMGELTAKTLLDNGARGVVVTSRTLQRAQVLADTFHGRAVEFGRLDEAIAEADIVISSTDSPHYVVTPDSLKPAVYQREGRPLFLIDMAVPRDIDPKVRELPNVVLYDVDDLGETVQANLCERQKEAAKVESIINDEVQKFSAWWRSLDSLDTIKALRRRAEGIREAELSRTLPRLSSLSDKDRETIDAMTAAIVNKLLHQPIIHLKNGNDGRSLDWYATVVSELFDL